MLIVPCGGGGLSAGIALALPETQMIMVEPEGWDDMARSLAAGEIVPVGEPAPPTRCDALQTLRVSPLTFGALREAGARGVAVSEAEIEAAMRVRLPPSADRRRAGRRGRAGRSAVRKGRTTCRTERWSWCRAGMSIRSSMRRSCAACCGLSERHDPFDEQGEGVDPHRRVAQLGRVKVGIDSRARQRGAVEQIVEQGRQAGEDRPIDRLECPRNLLPSLPHETTLGTGS